MSSEWTARFRRATALNVVTLEGIDEDIKSVEFIAPSDVYLTGRRYFNLATGEIGEIYGGNNSVTVKYATPITGVQKYIWFTSWGATIASGKELTIVAKSATHIYTRTITARAEGISFKQGWLNKLAVDMTSAQVEDIVDLSGNYLIAAFNSGWKLMNPDNPGKFFPAVNTTVTTQPIDVDIEAFNGISTLSNYIWTLTAVDGGYTIKNAYKNVYLALVNDDNEASAVTDVDDEGNTTLFSVTIDPDNHLASVNSAAFGERNLNYNGSSSRFAFYKPASNMVQVYLIPAAVDPRTKVTMSFAESEVMVPISESGIYPGQFVDVDPSVSEVTSNITYSWDNDNLGMLNDVTGEMMLGGTAGTATVTATFPGSTNYRPAKASFVLTVYDGSIASYVKITSAPIDWSGQYLLVSEGGAAAADSVMVLSGIEGTSTKIGVGTKVHLERNRIISTAEVDAHKVLIQKAAVAGEYIMNFGGEYLFWASGNSLNTEEDENENSRWSFAAGTTSGNWVIKCAADESREIWYNTGSPRFACYTGKTEATAGYAAIQLYQLEDDRKAHDLAWGSSTYEATLQTGNVTEFATGAPRLTNPHSLSVYYLTSDESVATFDKNTGAVVAHKGGQCIITAEFPGNSTYKPAHESYILTVTDNRAEAASPTFSPAEGSVVAGTVVTISSATEGATIYYTTNGANPSTSSTQGNTVTINESLTLKAIAVKEGYKNSAVASATYTVGGVHTNDGTLEYPYTATEAKALAKSGDTGTYYIKGKIKRVVNQFSAGYGTANFWISDDGSAETFEGYKIKYIGNVNWVEGNATLNAGDEVIINGTLTKYTPNGGGNTIPETSAGYLVSVNGITKALSIPTLTATPNNNTKEIAVTWGAATGSSGTVSYTATCGSSSVTVAAAGTYAFPMTEYGTYNITVTASASDALPATAKTTAKLTDPSIQSYSVTYTVSSKTAVTTTGTAPAGSTATYSQTYNTVSQATAGNSFTLTLSGFAGKKITGATVSVHSNKSGGAGYLSLTSGSSTLASIGSSSSGVNFNNAAWNGAYINTYVDKTLNVTATTIANGSTVVLTIGATTNSIFFQSLTLTYE